MHADTMAELEGSGLWKAVIALTQDTKTNSRRKKVNIKHYKQQWKTMVTKYQHRLLY